jgi:aspartate carbamoyltransferase catalytic subunit
MQKSKKASVSSIKERTDEDELAQEKKKYMEVSGLAAIQAKEKQRLEEPTPRKEEIEAEVNRRLN